MEYKEFGTWLQAELGCKAQKLSVDAGLTCPNRDGTLGRGGCTFCDNRTFNPAYCRQGGSITDQLEAGKRFFARKYPTMKYLAYFQSYSNSYGTLSHLKELYEEALRVPDVVGLVIGTRPDCMPDALLEYLEELNRRTFLLVEYGVESANEETLVRVNRGHTFAQARECIIRTAQRGIRVGVHMILGFPWETRSELIRQAQLIASLPITTLKLHQLQVIRGTQLAREYELHPWPLPTAEEYVDLVLEYISHLPPSLVLERFVSQSPPEYVIAPRWGLKNHEFSALVKKAIQKRSTQLGQ
ncbi:MAG: TIGR01212 family radical SAM protein [Bacteroidaceae bacterium]|nr:TIGR01212 family radical SAM protein [Paraprevotella sp.]MDD7241728.1 TIGR01212 family radical SAM protein [Paraprevotella sp.]MDY2715181.1 TIGR01212 family radical SAM protein [Bacteroidaceae bacterium]MDY5328113.1 TIGR01212 family radical SAM protein [Bacteroidaceae bacterium]